MTASVYTPDNAWHKVTLRDTGTGYPDVTRGDGVYSAYFASGVSSNPGHYAAVVTADSNSGRAVLARPLAPLSSSGHRTPCCGSSFPQFISVPSDQFARYSVPRSFMLNSNQLGGFFNTTDDVFPPNRITDLSATYSVCTNLLTKRTFLKIHF